MLRDLETHLKRSVRKHGVPGASVAVLRGSRISASAAAGVLNLDTAVKATTDSVFQIGSITKPMTATMIMQLRDEGRLDLDAAIHTCLPGFRVADMSRLGRITVRHLLSHQCGLDGDFFPPTDEGSGAIRHLLDQCTLLPSLFEPGEGFSYCNIGFSMLGRIIEVLDGRSYDDSLRARIFEPLAMTHALSRPLDNIRFRTAIGHVPGPDGKLVVPHANPYLSIGHKAAGATPAMTAADLLRFAAAHLGRGLALNGHRLLARRTAAEMLRPAVTVSRRPGASRVSFGLAWGLSTWGEAKVFSHDGGTVGQYSQLVVCPDKQMAVAVLTNGGDASGVFRDIVGGLFKALARLDMPTPPTPDTSAQVPLDSLTGTYANLANRLEVVRHGDQLVARHQPSYGAATREPDGATPLTFCSPRLALMNNMAVEFSGSRKEAASWLMLGSRRLNRTG